MTIEKDILGMAGSHVDVGGRVDANYGKENPNRRVEFAPAVRSSMRTFRQEQLSEIDSLVETNTAVRIGKVNRFRK